MSRPVQFALVLAVIQALTLAAGGDDEWRLVQNQARRAAEAKDYPAAEAFYDKAMHQAELFGKNNVRVASTLLGVAALLRSEKKLPAAEDAARRAVAIYAGSLGMDSVEYAEGQFTLAGVLMDQGRYQAAIRAIQLVVPVFEQKMGAGDRRTAEAICMQGDSYRLLSMYATAESPLRRCAELRLDDGGVGGAEFGEAANSLALVCQQIGKYADADRYFNYAAKIREQSLGIQSPELAETLEAHALLLHQLGRDTEAKQKEHMAAAIRAHSVSGNNREIK